MTERTARAGILRATEFAAVVLNLLYTWLYMHEQKAGFVAGALGSALFIYLCAVKKLYAEAVLQLFYVIMALYGLATPAAAWQVHNTGAGYHLPWIAAGCITALALGYGLRRFTDQQLPWADAFTSVFALIATWHMVNFIHENWLYWIAINTLSAFMYALRGLRLASGMFVIYLALSIMGYLNIRIY